MTHAKPQEYPVHFMKPYGCKKTICLLLTMLLLILPCMTVLGAYSATLDVRSNPSYLCCSIKDILDDTSGNVKKAETLYKNRFLTVTGRVESISDSGKQLELSPLDTAAKSKNRLTATTLDKNTAAAILNLKPNMTVRVYGTGVVNAISKKTTLFVQEIEVLSDSEAQEAAALEKHLQAEKLKGDKGARSYGFPGGKVFDSSASLERDLGNGKMTYLIPDNWQRVESPLPNVEGYVYRLNEIPTEFRTDAEQVFIFYFPLEKYVSSADRTNPDGIRRAIIKNITPNEKVSNINYPQKTVRSDSGRSFEYYDADYVDISGRNRTAEYVFTDAGDDAIACILYIFSESRHKDDILYMMGTLNTR